MRKFPLNCIRIPSHQGHTTAASALCCFLLDLMTFLQLHVLMALNEGMIRAINWERSGMKVPLPVLRY